MGLAAHAGRAKNLSENKEPRAVLRQGRRAHRKTTDDLGKVAGVTGLEPATSGVTGLRSNQLSYTPMDKRSR